MKKSRNLAAATLSVLALGLGIGLATSAQATPAPAPQGPGFGEHRGPGVGPKAETIKVSFHARDGLLIETALSLQPPRPPIDGKPLSPGAAPATTPPDGVKPVVSTAAFSEDGVDSILTLQATPAPNGQVALKASYTAGSDKPIAATLTVPAADVPPPVGPVHPHGPKDEMGPPPPPHGAAHYEVGGKTEGFLFTVGDDDHFPPPRLGMHEHCHDKEHRPLER